MSLFITFLNSGSNGNCYYVGNGEEAVLVDAGISCREIVKRLERLSLDAAKIKALFISHEHSDHIRGAEVFSRRYQLPVYITAGTKRFSGLNLDEALVRSFEAYQPVQVGALSVMAFPKLHDAADPHSFVVSGNGVNVGVFTDIGKPCDHVIRNFKTCHAAFLEANYDEEMLSNGHYPYHLKKRISSDKGHLSNRQALDLFLYHRPPQLSHLLLSHLSKENNHPEVASSFFSDHTGGINFGVASRDCETPVYEIAWPGREIPLYIPAPRQKSPVQMSLF